MELIIQTIVPLLLVYKYWALFGITFIAALILPVPPGIFIMASSAFAHDGHFNFAWVLVASMLGNILGDNAGYFLARAYGKDVLRKIGFRKVLESHKYHVVEKKLKRRPGFIIFISRFEVFTNLAVNIMCGLAKVPYRKYAPYQIIGEIVQVGFYGTLGYVVGSAWQSVNVLVGRVLLIVLLVAILIVVLFWKKISAALFREPRHL